MSASATPEGVTLLPGAGERAGEILTAEAVAFVASLHRSFEGRRRALLAARAERYRRLEAGDLLDFLPETAHVRAGFWQVPAPAPGLADRRVEITGPPDRKMTVNALNSGAQVWLADLEDSTTPTWPNVVGGQLTLYDAIRRRVDFTSAEGRTYALGEETATIVLRPRGWHLPEKHVLVDGDPVAGALVDYGLYVWHNAAELVARGAGPYFYLPKLESHLEARLWNDIFTQTEQGLGLPLGTIRATVLIETIPAAFEMEEILYELRDHAAGLNAGRWDYVFSVIKTFRSRGSEFLLPDRSAVTMTVPFLRAYTELLVSTCHRRGAHAIGGMAAFIPNRRDPAANDRAMEKVRGDKVREAGDGFDGSWVAHPDLVPLCRDVFDAVLGDEPHQIRRTRPDVAVDATQLLAVGATPGSVTETGLRANISVGVHYIASWLHGTGAVAIAGLMEDAATAEISRSQVWQWLHNDVVLADTGEHVSRELVDRLVGEEVAKLPGEHAYWEQAAGLFVEVATAEEFVEFLTGPAYACLP